MDWEAANLDVGEEVLGDRGNGQAVQRVGGDNPSYDPGEEDQQVLRVREARHAAHLGGWEVILGDKRQ